MGGRVASILPNIGAGDRQDFQMRLMRTNTSTDSDEYFKTFNCPALAVNPDIANTNGSRHIYVAYADKRSTNTTDRSDVFFSYSTNGGQTWTNSFIRVNADSGANDQWMPTITVRPDGNMRFVGWMDRRNDAGNSMIDAYGRFATIADNGTFSWISTDFRISTQSFPPVFSGMVANVGSYDPVWPPDAVSLNWWYDWWTFEDQVDWTVTSGSWEHEAGEHNGSFSDTGCVYFVWSDNRAYWTYGGSNTNVAGVSRYQTDIRLARFTWP